MNQSLELLFKIFRYDETAKCFTIYALTVRYEWDRLQLCFAKSFRLTCYRVSVCFKFYTLNDFIYVDGRRQEKHYFKVRKRNNNGNGLSLLFNLTEAKRDRQCPCICFIILTYTFLSLRMKNVTCQWFKSPMIMLYVHI